MPCHQHIYHRPPNQNRSSTTLLQHFVVITLMFTMMQMIGMIKQQPSRQPFNAVSAWLHAPTSFDQLHRKRLISVVVGRLRPQQQQQQLDSHLHQRHMHYNPTTFMYHSHNNYHHNLYRPSVLLMTTTTTTTSSTTDNATATVTVVSTVPTDFVEDTDAAATDQTTATTTTTNIIGIEYIQNCVVQVLHELYHPEQIARGRIIAKVLSAVNQQQKKTGGGKKKPNSKNNTIESTMTEEEPPKEVTVDEIIAMVDTEWQVQQQNRTSTSSTSSSLLFTKYDAAVTTATRSEFGDYQCNAAMTLATSLSALQQLEQMMTSSTTTTTTTTKITPRAVAEQIVTALKPKLQHMMDVPMEIAGPGFINMKFSKSYLVQALYTIVNDTTNRLGIPPKETNQKQRIVVDFSSPNIAKEMHVGHLRSTIIGDTLCNVLEFIGHDVVRLNHIGDWGTQFGMLVEHLRDEYPAALDPSNADNIDLGDLVVLYKAAKQRFDADDAFKQRARDGVVKLQAGDVESLAAWKSLCSTSRIEYQKIYDMLNIKGLNERGESFYNPYLSNVIQDLQDQGLAIESDGALAVFLDGYSNRDGTPLPMLVRKSDGGYNYATTDLAAIRHRTSMADGENADRVLYVTDAGQSQHFDMVFEVAKKAKFVPETSSLEHVPFGLVQGEDGKKFATRSGDTVKLKDLLNEAVHIAGKDLRERTNNDTSSDEFLNRVDRVARIVGIGAVKYADLSMNRESNYRFSYERMLSLNGNTAPYMLYAYARICSIVRKASGQPDDGTAIVWPEVAAEILITHESESDLIRNLVKLSDVIYEVERELYPNRICDYLFETSQKFNKFYESCSVNNAETAALKASRLSLCTATARTIRLLLTLLGIEVVDKL